MEYKYHGHTYSLELNDDGKIACRESDIVADTVDEVKKIIREQAEAETRAPRISVITFGGWTRRNGTKLFEGTTSSKRSGQAYWVTYTDEHGKKQRAKMSNDEFWSDTPENRAVLASIIERRKNIYAVQMEINDLTDKLTPFNE